MRNLERVNRLTEREREIKELAEKFEIPKEKIAHISEAYKVCCTTTAAPRSTIAPIFPENEIANNWK